MGDPSYRAVADLVVARIRAGELRPHARVPVAELEAAYGKAVAGAALAWLAANRWVVRAPGLGVRVSGAPPDLEDTPPDLYEAPPSTVSASSAAVSAVAVPAEAGADLATLLARVEELERWRQQHERHHRDA